MPTIRVYEPALCCNTGVCGPDVDQELVTFTADLEALRAQGVDVARANLASDPQAFAEDPTVVAFLRTAGSQGLPLTLVDGVTVLTGRHPSREEMTRWSGAAQHRELPLVEDSCCSGEDSSSCCGGQEASTTCCEDGDRTTSCCGGQNPSTCC